MFKIIMDHQVFVNYSHQFCCKRLQNSKYYTYTLGKISYFPILKCTLYFIVLRFENFGEL